MDVLSLSLEILLVLSIFYFGMIRPGREEKKNEARRAYLEQHLKINDEVIMYDGLIGRISKLNRDAVGVTSGPDQEEYHYKREDVDEDLRIKALLEEEYKKLSLFKKLIYKI